MISKRNHRGKLQLEFLFVNDVQSDLLCKQLRSVFRRLRVHSVDFIVSKRVLGQNLGNEEKLRNEVVPNGSEGLFSALPFFSVAFQSLGQEVLLNLFFLDFLSVNGFLDVSLLPRRPGLRNSLSPSEVARSPLVWAVDSHSPPPKDLLLDLRVLLYGKDLIRTFVFLVFKIAEVPV